MPMPATVILSEGGVAPPNPSTEAGTSIGAVKVRAKSRRVHRWLLSMAAFSLALIALHKH